MKRILELPIIRRLHRRRLLFPVVLSLVVVGVLVEGALSPDEESGRLPQIELPLPSISVPSIRPSLEKSPLTYQSDYWLQLSESVRNKLILIGPGKRPAVMVAPGVAVTSMAAVAEVEAEFHPAPAAGDALTVTEQPTLTTPMYRVLGVDAERGLALFGVKQPGGVGNFSKSEMVNLKPGANVLAISLLPHKEVQVIPGYVISITPPSGENTTSIDFSIPFPVTCETAAIVDLDGNLVGLSVKKDGGRTILSGDEVPGLVERLVQGSVCQAIQVNELNAEARQILGVRNGVLVERVVASAFVPEPSIHEGDILVSWNRQNVTEPAEFDSMYRETEPGVLVRYRVIRNRRSVSGATRMPGRDCLPVKPGLRFYPRLGISVEWKGDGWKVMRVLPDSVSDTAGIAVGDVIVGAGGRDLPNEDARPFERYESSPHSAVFTVRRNQRLRMVVIEPAAS